MALIDARRDLHLLQPKEDSDRGKNGATEEATTARNRRHGGQAFLTAKKRRFGDDLAGQKRFKPTDAEPKGIEKMAICATEEVIRW